MDNEEEMDKFLEKYNFPKLNEEEIENLNIEGGAWQENSAKPRRQVEFDSC